MGAMRIAILDDYQGVALSIGGWQRLPKDVRVVAFTDHVKDEDHLVARLEEFDVVCRMRERTEFPRRILERLPRLKLLCATGLRNFDSIDLPAAREHGIMVCATSSLHSPTLELVWGLIIGLMRRVASESASVRAGGWQVVVGRGLDGSTLGVVGLGTLGVPVARIGQAFGMRVIAWSPNLSQERADAALPGVRSVSREELFATADVITVHMPLASGTVGLIGADDIGRMKSTAYLVNTSRGPIVDEAALVAALAAGRIAGAGLDVYDDEPLPVDHPFRSLSNVLATPHIGYVTRQNYEIYFTETVENILAFIEGRPIRVIDEHTKRQRGGLPVA
jgi:phosphoglycerate dehydrogenase-like enzyme